jgi:hypothetical protein
VQLAVRWSHDHSFKPVKPDTRRHGTFRFGKDLRHTVGLSRDTAKLRQHLTLPGRQFKLAFYLCSLRQLGPDGVRQRPDATRQHGH